MFVEISGAKKTDDEVPCAIMQCERSVIKELIENTVFLNSSANRCEDCDHCKENGYSICLREIKGPFRRTTTINNEEYCACSHNIPEICNIETPKQQRNDGNLLYGSYRVCRHSYALLQPPRLTAIDQPTSVIVTVEPFWRDNYWKHLNLSNLLVQYEFPVESSDHCDGETLRDEDSKQNLCITSLAIEMFDTNTDFGQGETEFDQEATEEYYEDDGYSEIQFDKDVFTDAKSVRFWYTVDVKQPRQLDRSGRIVNVFSVARSSDLNFHLRPIIEKEKEQSVAEENSAVANISIVKIINKSGDNDFDNFKKKMDGNEFNKYIDGSWHPKSDEKFDNKTVDDMKEHETNESAKNKRTNESLITTTITTVLTKSKETEQKEVKIENDEVKFEKSAKNDKLRSDNWLTSKIFSTPGRVLSICRIVLIPISASIFGTILQINRISGNDELLTYLNGLLLEEYGSLSLVR
ncbi:unnamed protein product [Dracunculus medinensis]|uniref:ABC transporter domain-containing protein n=1 Tax=Dracunculus medinensis TaxID=318479 RepID=A0A0N4U413_DRAME|nr:unnamed protein product [Dracunculus medinensis]